MTQDRKMEVQTMNQVYRCYTEKREGFQVEAGKLLQDLKEQLGIAGLTRLRILCRYDAQGLTPRSRPRPVRPCSQSPW